MGRPISVIGVPTSAGSYAPGQEKAPQALRDAGLLKMLEDQGVVVADLGDCPVYRWQPDPTNPNARNAADVLCAARYTAQKVAKVMQDGAIALVLGGDCTIEIGTVAGAVEAGGRVGLIYFDLDTDLNVPSSTNDGALDWMGVAHILGVEGAVEEIARVGSRFPLLPSDSILFFGAGNISSFERRLIDSKRLRCVSVEEVARDPTGSATEVVTEWATDFDHILIHFDVDVIDFASFPIAENTDRRNGLTLDQTFEALGVLLHAPNLRALTITEVNPDHGAPDGSTIKVFATKLGDKLAKASAVAAAAS